MMSRVSLSRRSFLVAGGVGVLGVGAAAVGVEYDVLPGRSRAYDLLGLNGAAGQIPSVAPGPVARGQFDGVNWLVCRPPDAPAELPVVIAFHGAGGNAEAVLDNLAMDRFLAASGQQFAVAAIDGTRSYWHPRADGTDTGALVLETFLPMLADSGLDVRQPGFLGWSMGGYGALLLGSTLGSESGPICAASPALWPSYAESAPDAFDSEADFDAYGMFARREALADLDVRIDCGRGDPFFHNVEEFVDGTSIGFRPAAGGHDDAYWTRILPDQLTWLGARMAR